MGSHLLHIDHYLPTPSLTMATDSSLTEPVIERGPPNAVVYDLSESDHVTITLPVGSTWSSGLHWHEHHVEYLRVVKGSVQVTIGAQTHVISAGDPTTESEVRVERNVWHEWKRASIDSGQEVVVSERTDPEDGEKAVFFWNLNGVVLKAQNLSCPPYLWKWLHDLLLQFWVTLSLFAIFHHLDNAPVFVNVPQAFSKRGFEFAQGTLGYIFLRGVDRFISQVILLITSWVAWSLGISPIRDEFTPAEARKRWEVEKRAAGKLKER